MASGNEKQGIIGLTATQIKTIAILAMLTDLGKGEAANCPAGNFISFIRFLY